MASTVAQTFVPPAVVPLWQRLAVTVLDHAQLAVVNVVGTSPLRTRHGPDGQDGRLTHDVGTALVLLTLAFVPALIMCIPWVRRREWEQNQVFFLITHCTCLMLLFVVWMRMLTGTTWYETRLLGNARYHRIG